MSYAYWSGAVKDGAEARDHAAFARIAPGGPWQFRDWMHEGQAGVIAEWAGSSGMSYGTPRACADGLVYFPSRLPLRQEDLAKRNAPAGIDYTTTTGVTLTIPLAAAAPRFLGFEDGADAVGEAFGEFARLAERFFDRLSTEKKHIPWSDADLRRLILLAIGQCYRVTAEPLGELRWITTADVEPVLMAMMGSDPKALADAGEPSLSLASASAPSP